jgi:hypothetical protein
MSRRILRFGISNIVNTIISDLSLLSSFKQLKRPRFSLKSVAIKNKHHRDIIVTAATILLTMRFVKVGCSSLSAVRKIAVRQRREVHTGKLLNACTSTFNCLSDLFQYA